MAKEARGGMTLILFTTTAPYSFTEELSRLDRQVQEGASTRAFGSLTFISQMLAGSLNCPSRDVARAVSLLPASVP